MNDLSKSNTEGNRLLQIIKTYKPFEYADIIAEEKSSFLMEQLSDLRSNLISWLSIKEGDCILEIGSAYGIITSYLLSCGAQVTCIEDDEEKIEISKIRMKQTGIHDFSVKWYRNVSQLQRMETQEKYRFVFMLEPVAENEEQLVQLLLEAKSRLTADGEIIFVTDNVYGLKYWAGCKDPYTNDYYKGLEGYAQYIGPKAFSIEQIKRAIQKAEIEWADFYYPYPDRQFPMQIFSDERMPKEGELTNNFRNFDEERMIVFDESRVYDHLIADGKFSDFSNVYLVRMGQERSNESTVYVKYSNDRAIEYQIRTDIVASQEGYKVYKYPMSVTSRKHIREMYEHYNTLKDSWKETRLNVNTTYERQTRLEHEFLNEKSFEKVLDEHLENSDYEMLKKQIVKFADELRKLAKNQFAATQAFEKVFGEDYKDICYEWKSMDITDVDMIFPNLICRDNGWDVIDYEWTYTFPIPVEYVLFRSIYYYLSGQREARIIKEVDLYRIVGISEDEKKIFEKMEQHFQEYLTHGHVPMWKLYESMAGFNFFPLGELQRVKMEKKYSMITVSYAWDTQVVTKHFYADKNNMGCFMVQIPVGRNVDLIHVTFYARHCYMEIKGIFAVGEQTTMIDAEYSGVKIAPNKLMFPTDDISATIQWNKRKENAIYMEWSVEYCDYEHMMQKTLQIEQSQM